MNTLLRARRLIWIWALASATATFIITLGQKGTHPGDAILDSNVWIAALMGLLVSIAASPILTARWIRWYWGALLGLPLGLLVVFGFFFAKPHSWQPSRLDAWKSVAMFVDIYPFVIIPACILAGTLGSFLVCENADPRGVEE